MVRCGDNGRAGRVASVDAIIYAFVFAKSAHSPIGIAPGPQQSVDNSAPAQALARKARTSARVGGSAPLRVHVMAEAATEKASHFSRSAAVGARAPAPSAPSASIAAISADMKLSPAPTVSMTSTIGEGATNRSPWR